MIISIETEKAFEKIPHLRLIKTHQIRNRREHPQPNKKHLQKTYSSYQTYWERLNAFIPRSRTK